MKRKGTNLMALVLLLIGLPAIGQKNPYQFQREIIGTPQQWNRIILPDDIYKHLNPNLSNLRVLGIQKNGDTIEAPYLLRGAESENAEERKLRVLNVVQKDSDYFFTLEQADGQAISELILDFKNRNFDWQIDLEGSQNQKEWFTLLKAYRILSIENELTDYQFTKIRFPESNYPFFRIRIHSKEKPVLSAAKMREPNKSINESKGYAVKKFKVEENRKNKETTILVDLGLPVPVDYIKLNINVNFDFIRSFEISYLTDSFKTQTGWHYNYEQLTQGTLSSTDTGGINFEKIISNRLKIEIQNSDNQPLNYQSAEVKGPVYELWVRITEPGKYVLAYGKPENTAPNYDIQSFKDKIKKPTTLLQLGKETPINRAKAPGKTNLFQSKIFLWGIMLLIIITLGGFSLKLLKEK